jgi:hypothetical protein
MKRIIIVPITETGRFPSMEILARGGSVVALVGDTFEARTRSAFHSEDSFLYAAGYGHADLYTFPTLVKAAWFAKAKIYDLTSLELSILAKTRNAACNPRITPMAAPSTDPRKKRA